MFSWICPKCGKDVPPSYSECPNCAAVGSEPAAVVPKPDPEPDIIPPPKAVLPPLSVAPAPPISPPPSTFREAPASDPPPVVPVVLRSGGIPAWFATVLVTAGLAGLLAVLYLYVLPSRKGAAAGGGIKLETPQPAKPHATAAAVHPFTKHLELTGVRVSEERNNRLRFELVAVNHSAANMPPLQLQVGVRGSNNTLLEFPLKVPALGPSASKELSTSLVTALRAYELPDWQLLRADFRIISQP